jgi:hypothetical protein
MANSNVHWFEEEEEEEEEEEGTVLNSVGTSKAKAVCAHKLTTSPIGTSLSVQHFGAPLHRLKEVISRYVSFSVTLLGLSLNSSSSTRDCLTFEFERIQILNYLRVSLSLLSTTGAAFGRLLALHRVK